MFSLLKKFKYNVKTDRAILPHSLVKFPKSCTTLKTLSTTELEMAETVPGGEEIGCTVTFKNAKTQQDRFTNITLEPV